MAAGELVVVAVGGADVAGKRRIRENEIESTRGLAVRPNSVGISSG
jgi:hypothetical protein